MRIYEMLTNDTVTIELSMEEFKQLNALVRLGEEYSEVLGDALYDDERAVADAIKEFGRKPKGEAQAVSTMPSGQDNDGAAPGV